MNNTALATLQLSVAVTQDTDNSNQFGTDTPSSSTVTTHHATNHDNGNNAIVSVIGDVTHTEENENPSNSRNNTPPSQFKKHTTKRHKTLTLEGDAGSLQAFLRLDKAYENIFKIPYRRGKPIETITKDNWMSHFLLTQNSIVTKFARGPNDVKAWWQPDGKRTATKLPIRYCPGVQKRGTLDLHNQVAGKKQNKYLLGALH